MSANLQPIGRAFALVQPANERTALTSEPVKSTEEQVEIIKVGFFVFSLFVVFFVFFSSVGFKPVYTFMYVLVSGVSRGPQKRAAETPREPEDAVR